MQPHTRKLAWAAAGVFAAGAVSGWSAPGLLGVDHSSARAAVADTTVPSTAAAPSAIAPGEAPNYRAIVAQNKAAVVGITTAGEMNTSSSPPFDFNGPFGNDDNGNNPFRFFFRNRPGPQGEVPMRGLGSGFIVSADGLVLTNAHVVDGAKTVSVKLADHREFKARVLGADKTSDIAVLKIDAHALPTVRLGDSDQLAVGDYVLAIGEPFGLEETATAGIVSATSRSLPGDGYVPFIQTDAAVNPGNSGGPLFDAGGKVVGINSQIYTNSGGYQGVSFAIPINLAEQVKDQIVATGKVEHGRLGVQVQNLDQSLADSFKLKAPSGALVSNVEPDSAAARAGLKPGDVISKYNGAAIDDAGQLSARVNATAPGSPATLEIWRQGKVMTLTARIGSAADSTVASGAEHGQPQTQLGLTLRPLTADEREQAGVSGGLVVENAQGPAAQAGIQRGDVVLSIDGKPVQSLAQMRQLVHGSDQRLALLIQRGDSRIFVPIALG